MKSDAPSFADQLTCRDCRVEQVDGMLRVVLPAGEAPALIWRLADQTGTQVRTLKPVRNTLEEVFFQAVSEPT